MAAWQATYWLVPTEPQVENPEIAWRGLDRLDEVRSALDSLLAPASSWSAELLCWGETDAHDVQAALADGGLESVRVRIDVRSEGTDQLLERITHVLDSVGAELVNERGVRVVSAPWAIAEDLAQSDAARFVHGPRDYLDDHRDRSV